MLHERKDKRSSSFSSMAKQFGSRFGPVCMYNFVVEFASTPGGELAYWKDLFAVPVVATCNYTTKNLGFLDTDDFLANPENRTLLNFPPAPPPPAPP